MKTRDEIQADIDALRGAGGFAAADDDAADKVLQLCGNVAAVAGNDVNAFDPVTLITLAITILPIIFGGEFSLDKLTAVLELIKGIFS